MSRIAAHPKLERDRKKPKTGNWYIYWTENGRSRERSTGTSNRSEAERIKAEWTLKNRKIDGIKQPDEILVTFALSNYMAKRLDKVSDPDRIRNAVKALVPYWKHYSIADINESKCDEYVQKRNVANETVRRELGVLSAAVNRAFDDQIISRKVRVFKPPRKEGRIRFLSCDEAITLLRASRNEKFQSTHLTLFILIGLLTGKRKEAILSLKWSDIDFKNDHIDWNPVGRARTKKIRPRNPIPKRLLLPLLTHKSQNTDDYVITFNGKGIKDIKTSFSKAVRRSGLNSVGHQSIHPHTLRHTCATWLMQKGIDKWEATGFLGMSLETLEKNYGHHHHDFQHGAKNAF